MKRWLRLSILICEAVIVLAAVYFEPNHCVRGIMRGETFYRGRPSSYWAEELEGWEVITMEVVLMKGEPPVPIKAVPFFQRQPTWFEQTFARWLPQSNSTIWRGESPAIMCGDDLANDVLRELLNHSSPNVCRLARIGLGADPLREFCSGLYPIVVQSEESFPYPLEIKP
jgi:hypothetical protein